MSNKKIMIISVVSVIVLVIAIIATSYAMFTANLSGSKENELTTGYVTLNCEETTFKLEDTSPMTDEQGTKLQNNEAKCVLTSTMNGQMTVGYDIALDDVDKGSENDGISEDNVKIQVSKSINESTQEQPKYLLETENKGIYVSSIKESKGTYDTEQGYNIDHDTITGDKQITYTIKVWVSDKKAEGSTEVEVPNTYEKSSNGTCSDPEITTENECKAAGEIWGEEQTSTQKGGTFSFKLKIGATQVLNDSHE